LLLKNGALGPFPASVGAKKKNVHYFSPFYLSMTKNLYRRFCRKGKEKD